MRPSSDGSNRPSPDTSAPAPAGAASPGRAAPRLALVSGSLHLAEPSGPVPAEWRSACGALLDWLGVETAFVPAPAAAPGVPVFAPWLAACPIAFQNGGTPGLPAAEFAVSYCLEHGRAFIDPRRGPADIMLISPHPAVLSVAAEGGDGVPRAETMRAMIRAAVAERRARIAIIVPARHCAAIGDMQLSADQRLCPAGVTLDIRSPEEALARLVRGGQVGWDAIIAMPDLRGMVFALLAETTDVRGPWPMVWRGPTGPVRITVEALAVPTGSASGPGAGAGAGAALLPLDATALAQALMLALHGAGRREAAIRLFEAWSRLRSSGISTPARYDDAPYATEVPEAEFVALMCHSGPEAQRAETPWRALESRRYERTGNHPSGMRVVSANLASS